MSIQKGGYQSFLVLTALASRDLALTYPKIKNAYKELYVDIPAGDQYNAAFEARARLSLQRGGFPQELIDQVEWHTFTSDVRQALAVISDSVNVFSPYTGGGCPCLSDLIAEAAALESGGITASQRNTENEQLRARIAQLEAQLGKGTSS